RIAPLLRARRRRRFPGLHHARNHDQIGVDRPRLGHADLRDFRDVTANRRNEPLLVRDIAHARAGDKGDTSNVSVWAYDRADFEQLVRTVTPERIKREFPHLVRGEVQRYVIDHLHGINLVMRNALEGGVNASLNLDSHGKSWSYLI